MERPSRKLAKQKLKFSSVSLWSPPWKTTRIATHGLIVRQATRTYGGHGPVALPGDLLQVLLRNADKVAVEVSVLVHADDPVLCEFFLKHGTSFFQ